MSEKHFFKRENAGKRRFEKSRGGVTLKTGRVDGEVNMQDLAATSLDD